MWKTVELIFAVFGAVTAFALFAVFAIDWLMKISGFDPANEKGNRAQRYWA